MKTRHETERQWVSRTWDSFCELEKLKPEIPGMKALPKPRVNLARILMRVSHPGVNVRLSKKWGAKELGRFLGREYALEALLGGQVPVSSVVKEEHEKFKAWAASRSAQHSGPADAIFKLEFAGGVGKWTAAFKTFVKEALVSACERPYPEAAGFFSGFGKATVIKPDEFETKYAMSVGEKVANVMYVNWESLSQLESAGQLYRVLAKAGEMAGVVVTKGAVEKLCRAIGLRYRGRGRPRKLENRKKVVAGL